LDDNNTAAWFLRGQTFYYTDNYDQAIKHYQECLRRDPDYGPAANELKRVRSIDRGMRAAREAVFVRKFEESLQLFTDVIALIDRDNTPLISKLQSERGEALYRCDNDRP
jgi:tetratricopeptide (TPR) repeat protein